MLQLAFLILLFLLLTLRLSTVLWTGLILGLAMELYTVTPFGLLTSALLLSLILIHWLFAYFFTNRSLPALLMMGAAGTLIFRILFLIFNILATVKSAFGLSFDWRDYFLVTLWETATNTLLLLIIFTIAKRFNKRLKTVFLIK